jgi:hypothetical protein
VFFASLSLPPHFSRVCFFFCRSLSIVLYESLFFPPFRECASRLPSGVPSARDSESPLSQHRSVPKKKKSNTLQSTCVAFFFFCLFSSLLQCLSSCFFFFGHTVYVCLFFFSVLFFSLYDSRVFFGLFDRSFLFCFVHFFCFVSLLSLVLLIGLTGRDGFWWALFFLIFIFFL